MNIQITVRKRNCGRVLLPKSSTSAQDVRFDPDVCLMQKSLLQYSCCESATTFNKTNVANQDYIRSTSLGSRRCCSFFAASRSHRSPAPLAPAADRRPAPRSHRSFRKSNNRGGFSENLIFRQTAITRPLISIILIMEINALDVLRTTTSWWDFHLVSCDIATVTS